MSHAEQVLTFAGVILQIGLLLVLWLGTHYKRFPVFFSLTLFSVASTIALFAVRGSPRSYFWVYWISEACNTLIIFFALHEIFRTVFTSFYRMLWFRMLFPAVGALMAVVAVLRSLLHPMPVGSRLYAIIVSLEIGIGFLQMGIFALFLMLGKIFRVRYERHPFGLALGFGLVASGWFVAYLLRSEIGTQFDPIVRSVTPVTYTLGLVVWLFTFLVKEPTTAQPSVTTGLTPEQMLSDVKRYTEAAKRIFRH